jgi:hypothetical protein
MGIDAHLGGVGLRSVCATSGAQSCDPPRRMARRWRWIPGDRSSRCHGPAGSRNDPRARRSTARGPRSGSTVVAVRGDSVGATRHRPLHQLGGSLAGNDATPESSTSSRSRIAGSATSVTSACRSPPRAVLCFGATAVCARTDLIWNMPAQSPVATSISIGPEPHFRRDRKPTRFEGDHCGSSVKLTVYRLRIGAARGTPARVSTRRSRSPLRTRAGP